MERGRIKAMNDRRKEEIKQGKGERRREERDREIEEKRKKDRWREGP